MNWTVVHRPHYRRGVLPSAVAGFGLGLSLIVAIGAQNLYVLGQGMRRQHALLVATICAVSDAALIVLGVSGLGVVLLAVPWLIDAVRWAGFAFLLGYGLLAARRAWRPTGQSLQAGTPRGDETPGASPVVTGTRALPVVLACLALTWLNPHVYLDTVFLLGSVANTHGDHRWWFAAGAALASVVWFFALALGASRLGRWLGTPRAWRILDAVIAVVMITIAVSLVLPA
ncbi:LysE/ArgO family amino acid transporter [Microbacterium sp.]|uniref:LysE/ArgO family amino acid transporter n=1 Tax=Microbacterium sp. TaxID=51671 RepID=UPI003A84C037